MCYMRRRQSAQESVGIRELRQNLSVYLARLATGTVFRVTDRGRAVALLIPLPSSATTVERLVSAGRAVAPARDLASLGRPTVRTKRPLSEALREVRDDRV
jgi:antitoxin (DNA-binding transcriptional repressor) of toxin-antitoxin stability system